MSIISTACGVNRILILYKVVTSLISNKGLLVNYLLSHIRVQSLPVPI